MIRPSVSAITIEAGLCSTARGDHRLQVGDGGGLSWLGSQPVLEGLLESLDFAAGGGVVGSAVLLDDAEQAAERESARMSVLTATENGYGKRTPIAEYTKHGRGTQGMIAIQTTARNGDMLHTETVSSTPVLPVPGELDPHHVAVLPGGLT